jgi:hypothetical protein
MAKGQKRNSREPKKPKAKKPVVLASAPRPQLSGKFAPAKNPGK